MPSLKRAASNPGAVVSARSSGTAKSPSASKTGAFGARTFGSATILSLRAHFGVLGVSASEWAGGAGRADLPHFRAWQNPLPLAGSLWSRRTFARHSPLYAILASILHRGLVRRHSTIIPPEGIGQDMDVFVQQLINGLTLGSIYGLIA